MWFDNHPARPIYVTEAEALAELAWQTYALEVERSLTSGQPQPALLQVLLDTAGLAQSNAEIARLIWQNT